MALDAHWIGTCILICARCGQVNRAPLPLPSDRGIQCGNRSCRSRLEFDPYQTCPMCHSRINAYSVGSVCRSCGNLLEEIPFPPRRPEPLAPPRAPNRLKRMVSPQAQSEYSRLTAEYARSVELLARIQESYNEKLVVWRQQVGEIAARAEWKSLYSRYRISDLWRLTGEQFEDFLRNLFVAMGYRAKVTQKTGDQGADLIVSRPKARIAVQAKRQDQPVGNRAVQELLGGMLFYKCHRGIVATTSTFTRSAQALAAKDQRITLWDARKLSDLYAEYLGVAPPFSWEEYHRLKRAIEDGSK